MAMALGAVFVEGIENSVATGAVAAVATKLKNWLATMASNVTARKFDPHQSVLTRDACRPRTGLTGILRYLAAT
jgi:hypothetical protein